MRKINQILKIALIVNLQLLMFNCFAQVDSLQTDSFEVHTIKGREYYIHIVEKGGSLYAIHKKYDVPLEILRKENPSVLDGLSIGEEVFIPVKKKVEFKVKADGNFINHYVKKKQTLYAIANLYGVKQKEIIAANPGVEDGLKYDQEIKIPVLNIKKEDPKKGKVNNNNYYTHTIQKGETFYGLSRQYKVTAEAIKKVNGGLEQGLKKGETIYIPITILPNKLIKIDDSTAVNLNTQLVEMIFDSIFTDTANITDKNEYIIGLFLPFYLDANDELVENRNVLDKKDIYPKSKFAIEFYNGVKMALDSVSTDSCKFKLYVYDTNGNDSIRIKSVLEDSLVEKLDLILGPLYYDNFKRVALFAQKNNIPIVSPVKQSNKILLGNQQVFKAIPSKSTTLIDICTMVVDSFKTENLMAISYDQSKEKLLIDSYIETYNNQILSSEDTTLYASIKTLNVSSDFDVIINSLHPIKNNVIFVPTTDRTFITNLFTALTTVLSQEKYNNYQITLIGLEEWMGFENIDLAYFEKLNVHYCSARYINDEDDLVKNFVRKYVSKNETYPSKNTFLGFDLTYYLGKTLMQKGILFSPGALENYKGLSIHLSFCKTGVESGFENTKSFVLRVNNFTLEKVN